MSALLPVAEALARVLADVEPVESDTVSLAEAFGRVLATPLAAKRTQPPFDVSAMDGYAVRAADVATLPAELAVIGAAPAGHAFAGRVEAGQAVRIFTGAALPEGADSILLQEDASIAEDGALVAKEVVRPRQHVRARGLDFVEGRVMVDAGTRLGMRQMTLAAAMNHAAVPVRREPRVAIIATGDELVPPGADAPPDRIVASNTFGIEALVRSLGGLPIDLGIVPDDRSAFAAAVDRAVLEGADILVTLGGASVGDHDFAQEVLASRGMTLGFWKIAMRPGKPLIFGRLGPMRVLGLPGNPVSSLVCALLFLRPLIEALLGLPPIDRTETAELGAPMQANDRRQDYVRATLSEEPDGRRIATAFARQDSSMLSTFAEAGCLIIREPFAPPAAIGAACRILRLP
ncbi:molybdopterin molybdotransferase MoeA [Kaistia dalseonensis]|uniref:Molybdopterin molybdenumtransferase n=1 Tax=Kaistia dalseonensis TaxID=410840 RepID=A0ABU0H241_9HYPH|nr:gephyrin-like molybdotransferase Glp [Kaistia dalseonensis]MCX5493788.1 molybdopterin molybdotransferase MoeA [Kaistia dalseonensis]MDQ0436352.1 molybdopterin molybdotransferase [Kaistia dalseonensis]